MLLFKIKELFPKIYINYKVLDKYISHIVGLFK